MALQSQHWTLLRTTKREMYVQGNIIFPNWIFKKQAFFCFQYDGGLRAVLLLCQEKSKEKSPSRIKEKDCCITFSTIQWFRRYYYYNWKWNIFSFRWLAGRRDSIWTALKSSFLVDDTILASNEALISIIFSDIPVVHSARYPSDTKSKQV